MKIGKLSNDQLQELILNRLPPLGDNIVVGAGIGLDCALVKSPPGLLVVSADPITGAAANIGHLAVHISCNDIAACGVCPTALTMVLIAPPSATETELGSIMEDAATAAREIGVSIIGGHTEISDAVTRFVIMTTAFGFTGGKDPIDSRNCRPGDTLIMTKTAGLEGTSILASDQVELLKGVLSEAELQEAQGLIEQISIIPEGIICADLPVHGMHDSTEGGILGAAYELSDAAGTGCEIRLADIDLHPLTVRITTALALDPYRLLASGSLLIATPEPEAVLSALKAVNIPARAIGHLTTDSERWLIGPQGRTPLDPPAADELYRI